MRNKAVQLKNGIIEIKKAIKHKNCFWKNYVTYILYL